MTKNYKLFLKKGFMRRAAALALSICIMSSMIICRGTGAPLGVFAASPGDAMPSEDAAGNRHAGDNEYQTEGNDEQGDDMDTASAKERLIVDSDAADKVDKGRVLSQCGNIYLLGFEDAVEAERAYDYYLDADCSVSFDSAAFTAADGKYAVGGPADGDANPIEELKELTENGSGAEGRFIALIDTGSFECENVISGVSVLGDDPRDDNGHGSRMTEYILEEDPDARLLSIKALDNSGRGSVSSVYAGIRAAIDSGAEIICLCFSGIRSEDTAIIEEVINEAVSKGITVIGAAGNNGRDAEGFVPGCIEGAYIAGAMKNGKRLGESNYGETVDLYIEAASTSEAAARAAGIYYRDGAINMEDYNLAAGAETDTEVDKEDDTEADEEDIKEETAEDGSTDEHVSSAPAFLAASINQSQAGTVKNITSNYYGTCDYKMTYDNGDVSERLICIEPDNVTTSGRYAMFAYWAMPGESLDSRFTKMGLAMIYCLTDETGARNALKQRGLNDEQIRAVCHYVCGRYYTGKKAAIESSVTSSWGLDVDGWCSTVMSWVDNRTYGAPVLFAWDQRAGSLAQITGAEAKSTDDNIHIRLVCTSSDTDQAEYSSGKYTADIRLESGKIASGSNDWLPQKNSYGETIDISFKVPSEAAIYYKNVKYSAGSTVKMPAGSDFRIEYDSKEAVSRNPIVIDDTLKRYVFIYVTGESNQQDLGTLTYNMFSAKASLSLTPKERPAGIRVAKRNVSADWAAKIVQDNPLYSLEGTRIGVFTRYRSDSDNAYAKLSSGGNAILITDKSGNTDKAELGLTAPVTLYFRELCAPRGYSLSNETVSKEIPAGVTIDDPQIVTLTDKPVYASGERLLRKLSGADPENSAAVQGAVFKIEYYTEYIDSVDGKKPARVWYIESDKDGYVSLGNGTLKGSGSSDLYLGEKGTPVLPLGSIAISELTPAEGYQLKGLSITDSASDKVYEDEPMIMHIKQTGSGSNAAALYNIEGKQLRNDGLGDIKEKAYSAAVNYPFPEIVTKADSGTGYEWIYADEDSKPVDYVSLKHLLPDTEYILLTRLVTGEEDALGSYVTKIKTEGTKGERAIDEEVTAELELAGGSISFNDGDITFCNYLFYAEDYAEIEAAAKEAVEEEREASEGEETEGESEEVVDEELDEIRRKAIAFSDISNMSDEEKASETVTVICNPEIKTMAFSKEEGIKTVYPASGQNVTDEVQYSGICTGHEYKLSASLIDAETMESVAEAESVFTPEEPDGSTFVTFKDIDLSGCTPGRYVVYEMLTHKDKVLAEHRDLGSEEQTVIIPSIETKASSNIGGGNILPGSGAASITDTVSYKGLIPGETYVLKGTLHAKGDISGMYEDGEPVNAKDGNEICAETVFTPDTPDGTVDVTFAIDMDGIPETDLVVFEEMTLTDGTPVAEHKDLESKEQTLRVIKEKIVLPAAIKYDSPQPVTGDSALIFVAAILLITSLSALSAIIIRKRKSMKR